MEEEEDPGKPGDKPKTCDSKGKVEMSQVLTVPSKVSATQENGVLLTNDMSSSDDEAHTVSLKKIKLTDDNTSDTAETIKKIQAFIALGKSDEYKKEPELVEKPSLQKSTSKKVLESRENHEETGEEKVNNISELQRTLQGLDDSQDADQADPSVKSGSIKTTKKSGPLQLHKENKREGKSNEIGLVIGDPHTPSRVSKRIQSKSIKFSAKKMLRGDDVNVLKRMIPGYEKEKKKKERVMVKAVKSEPKKIPQGKMSSSIEEEDALETELSSLTEDIEQNENLVVNTTNLSPSVSNVSPKTTNSSIQAVSPSSPVSPKLNPVLPQEPKGKPSALVDQLGKFAVTNGKITLELSTAQQKKVVRIAVPPPTTSSPSPKASLGPDIIIKRVKPVKKTVVLPDNAKENQKASSDKELHNLSINLPQITKMTPRVNIERIPVRKIKDDLYKIQKNIIKSGKNDIKSNITSVKYVNLKKPLEESITDSKIKSPISMSNEAKIDSPKIDKNKDISPEESSLIHQISEALENKSIQSTTGLQKEVREDMPRKLQEKLPRGRKPYKLTSTGIKSKSDSYSKRSGKLRNDSVERSPSVSDAEEPLEDVESDKDFSTIFDKYFSTNERYVEHHDSLDSDSSTDLDNFTFTHFINTKQQKPDKASGEATVYDLMQDISIELPTWNIHASSNGDLFYLVQIDTSEDKPIMKKVVELDLDNNAKVYVNNKLVPQYEGKYDSYEDIRKLIYNIDQI